MIGLRHGLCKLIGIKLSKLTTGDFITRKAPMSDTPSIQQHKIWIKSAFKMVDALAIGSGLSLLLVWQPQLNSDSTIVSCLVAIGIFSIVAEFFGLYRSWNTAFEREVVCSLGVWATTLLILVGLGKFSSATTEFSGAALTLWFAITPTLSLSMRIVLRRILALLVKNGINTRGYAVYGATELGGHLATNIERSPEHGFKFMGFYDDRPEQRSAKLPDAHQIRLGKMDDLVAHAKAGNVEVVFIALPMQAEPRIREVIAQLSDTTAAVYVVPDLFTFQLLHSRWVDFNGVPVVSVHENPLYGVDGVLKRASDVALACVGIVLMALPMMIIALAVKLTSRGAILFMQKRYGLDGKEFAVWKFRTMTVCDNGSEIRQATKNDSRLTPIGGFLRRTSLDELPQLFNVLLGTMSLVGPRPHATAHNELYRSQIDGYMLRHKVKPGITGWAQVNGFRGETETLDKMENRVRFDHQYIREWSIWFDLKILWRTFFVVCSRQNAY
jgi:putative colanic acid biosynthesis UDP-glucose lipid carrier transferase